MFDGLISETSSFENEIDCLLELIYAVSCSYLYVVVKGKEKKKQKKDREISRRFTTYISLQNTLKVKKKRFLHLYH